VLGKGSFGGVRLITAKQLASKSHLLRTLRSRGVSRLEDICVVEYKGTYRLDEVEDPMGRPPDDGVGHYAIVVVSRSTNKLIGTFVRATLPVRFRHLALRHLGPISDHPSHGSAERASAPSG